MRIEVSPIPEAVKRIAGKTPVASRLRTRDWERVPLELREAAQFSAGVESIRIVSTIQDKLSRRIGMEIERVGKKGDKEAFVDRSSFVRDLRRVVAEEGIPLPTGAGTLTDIGGKRRLDLIYEFQTTQAAEYARYKMANDPDVLDAYPAQELVRVESRRVPREWSVRWARAGGKLPGGRMVALKSDPVWTKISRFGTPFPPFDFGSGMGLDDIERDEAEALGIIAPGETPKSPEAEFQDRFEFSRAPSASVARLSPNYRSFLKDAFGDQIQESDGRVVWQGRLVRDFVDEAISAPQEKKDIDLGEASARTTVKAAAAGQDISGWRLRMTADDVRHVFKEHGGDQEIARGQVPVTPLDFELLPHVWRDPDAVSPGDAEGAMLFEKRILGRDMAVLWLRSRKYQTVGVKTMWVKK